MSSRSHLARLRRASLVGALLAVSLVLGAGAWAQTVYPPPPPPDTTTPGTTTPGTTTPGTTTPGTPAGEDGDEDAGDQPEEEVGEEGPAAFVPPVLPPGEAALYVDGRPIPYEVLFGFASFDEFRAAVCELGDLVRASDDGTGVVGLLRDPAAVVPLDRILVVRGLGDQCVSIVIPGLSPDGDKVVLDDDGTLDVGQDEEFAVDGDGFAPDSVVDLTIFSDPVDIGSVAVDGLGIFFAFVTASAPVDDHTLLVTGTLPDGARLDAAVGMRVSAEGVPVPSTFLGLSPLAISLIVAAGLVLLGRVGLLAARRRRAQLATGPASTSTADRTRAGGSGSASGPAS
jgi:hypothetical protein